MDTSSIHAVRQWPMWNERRSILTGPRSVRKPDPDGADDFRLIAAIERFGRVAERLEFHATMHVPGTIRRAPEEGHPRDGAKTQKPEFVVDAGELIVVLQAETNGERKGNGEFRVVDSRSDPELEIRSSVLSAVRLSEPRSRVEFKSQKRMRPKHESGGGGSLIG